MVLLLYNGVIAGVHPVYLMHVTGQSQVAAFEALAH